MTVKLNRNFYTAIDFISKYKKPYYNPEAPMGYGSLYEDGTSSKPEPLSTYIIAVDPQGKVPEEMLYTLHQWRGMLRPIVKVKKYFTDFNQPYHTQLKFRKDLLQFSYGLMNIAEGLLNLTMGLISFVICLPIATLTAIFAPSSYFYDCPLGNSIKNLYIHIISWLIYGILSIFKGVLLIILSPITLLMKVPHRSHLTKKLKIQNKMPAAEDKKEIKRLSQLGLNLLQTIAESEKQLVSKINKEPERKERIASKIAIVDAKISELNESLEFIEAKIKPLSEELDELRVHYNEKRKKRLMIKSIINRQKLWPELLSSSVSKNRIKTLEAELRTIEKELDSVQEKIILLSGLKREKENIYNQISDNQLEKYCLTWAKNSLSDEVIELKESYNESVLKVMRIIYEINRKWTRSTNDGWRSELKIDQINQSYKNCQTFFKINKHGRNDRGYLVNPEPEKKDMLDNLQIFLTLFYGSSL